MVINLLELFDLSVTKNGDKIAIVDGTRTISFNDLDKKSDILSQKIHNIAESVNRPVAVFSSQMYRSCNCKYCDYEKCKYIYESRCKDAWSEIK